MVKNLKNSFKKYKKITAKVNTENPDPDPKKWRMLYPDPNPYIMYTYPKHWVLIFF
jgi:hypothetical protein